MKLRSKYQRKTAERLVELIPEDKKKTFEILDVACGTGLIGSYLAEHGITSIDGVGKFLAFSTFATNSNMQFPTIVYK